MAPPKKTTWERFWSKVDKSNHSGCWAWTGGLFDSGYGVFKFHGKNLRAHKVAYFLENGVWDKQLVVRHLCHNKACCNPAHLALGTNLENAADDAERDVRKGVRNGRAVLTEEQVHQIRADPRSCVKIAADYGVADPMVVRIKKMLAWKHLAQDPARPTVVHTRRPRAIT